MGYADWWIHRNNRRLGFLDKLINMSSETDTENNAEWQKEAIQKLEEQDETLSDKEVRAYTGYTDLTGKGEKYGFSGFKTKDVKDFIKEWENSLIPDDYPIDCLKKLRKLAGEELTK